MIKGIIFDLDNTLADYIAMKTTASDAALSAMIGAGLEIEKKKAKEILYDLYDAFSIEDNTIFQKFLLKVSGEIDYKILTKAIVAYRRMREGYLEPYPFVSETLLKLKVAGLKLAVLSDAPKLKCWIRLAALNITDFFDIVVAYDDTQTHKPASLPFEVALARMGLKPEEVLMVGDNRERDVLGAKKVGIKTVHAAYGIPVNPTKKYSYGSKDIKADYSIDSFKELLEVPEVRMCVSQAGMDDYVYETQKFL